MTITARLRPLDEDDRARLFHWRNQEDIRRWMYTDHEIGREEHDRWFTRVQAAEDRRYWVVEADGRPVGLANLVGISQEEGRAEWAFYLADPSVRGTGLGAWVEFAVLERVFGELGLRTLACEVLEGNAGVLKLHRAFGFVETGRVPARVVRDGAAMDAIRLELTANAWEERREASKRRLERVGFSV